MLKIMIIEDDTQLRNQVKEVLLGYGHLVYAVETFHNIEDQFESVKPDLLLLDINLPYFDGNYFCRIFRKKSNIPIIITSARNSDMDQILSIELGADEYIVKPFNIQVLMAKINAVIRRLYGEYAISENSSEVTVNGITLDDKSFRVTYKNVTEELSKNEYKLMKKFILNVNNILTREVLLEEIWDVSSFVDDNTLTVNVTRLKSKLANVGIKDAIQTKRGAGYIFDTRFLESVGLEGLYE